MDNPEQQQLDHPKPINGDPVHWWREPLAGIIAIGVSCYDIWIMGKEKGLSGPLDELVLHTGIALIAGVRNLFGARTPAATQSDVSVATERQRQMAAQIQRIEEKLSK